MPVKAVTKSVQKYQFGRSDLKHARAKCTILHNIMLWLHHATSIWWVGAGSHIHQKLVWCGTNGQLLLSGFQALATATLTLDRVIRHTIVHQSSTSIYIPNFVEIAQTFLWTD